MELLTIVEALLFSYQEPLSAEHMVKAIRDTARDIVDHGSEIEVEAARPLLKVSEAQVTATVQQLIAAYEASGRAFTVAERPTGWRLCARGEYAEWCRALYPGKKQQRLSQPALETLAIIAYRQPITRSGMEAVRGVSVDTMVQQLIDRGFVRVMGRADLPGRPILYGTTDAFLEHFSVKAVDELPNAQELRRVQLPSEGPPGSKTAAQSSVSASQQQPELPLALADNPEPATAAEPTE